MRRREQPDRWDVPREMLEYDAAFWDGDVQAWCRARSTYWQTNLWPITYLDLWLQNRAAQEAAGVLLARRHPRRRGGSTAAHTELGDP